MSAAGLKWWNWATCLCIVVAATACGGSGSGGGGGGVGQGSAGPVGLPNNPCDPTAVNEGCALGNGVSARLKCNVGTQTWQLIEQCPADKTCTWTADPADPTGGKKLSMCGQPLAADTSGGGNDSGGLTDAGSTASDSGTGGDGTGSSGSSGSSGGSSDGGAAQDAGKAEDPCGNNACDNNENATSCPIDCAEKVAAKWKCIAGECKDEYAGCMAVGGCKTLVQCIAACADDTCAAGCAKGINSDTAKAYQKLGACMAKANCDDGTGPQTKCGDLKCEGDENASNCPQDCKPAGPVCGDGACEGTENADNCAKDCAKQIKCGDGNCVAPTETMISCPLDCNAQIKPATLCLKAKCGAKLDACVNDAGCMAGLLKAFQCPIGDQNCLTAAAQVTGGGQLLYNSVMSCALLNDCALGAPAQCGNAKCEQGETKTSCPQDCGECATVCVNKECGTIKECNNKVCGGCGAGLKCSNNVCVKGEPVCGDGSCDGTETKQNCAQDCATEPAAVCGNGKCEGAETQKTCPKDCNAQTQCDCKAKGFTCGFIGGCANSCGTCKTNEKCTSNKCVTAATCGNKVCEAPYENASSCPLDCSKAADCNTSCQGRCGKYSGGCKCQCDNACVQYNDCCPDKKKLCG